LAEEKKHEDKEKITKRIEAEQKRRQKKKDKEKDGRESKKQPVSKKKTSKMTIQKKTRRKKTVPAPIRRDVSVSMGMLNISRDAEDSDSEAECPKCGLIGESRVKWIYCDRCNTWMDIDCARQTFRMSIIVVTVNNFVT